MFSCGLWSVVCGLFLTGCALVVPITPRVPAAAGSSSPGTPQSYRDYTGVIHVHTVYSDGGGTFEELGRIANQQHLDYLIVTDHNTLQAQQDGKQGWYGMTLILVGTEISTPGGHYVALNVHREISRHQPTQTIIDEVNAQGGLGFIAHPYYKRRRWTDWSVHGMAGIEGFNMAHEVLDVSWVRLALSALTSPAEPLYLSFVQRPYDPLATWDELIQRHGRIVGIGSSDAHGLRVLGLKITPYEIMFKLIRTHLLIPQNTKLSEQSVYDALKQGHAFFSIDLLTDASGFTFSVQDDSGSHGVMGDEIAFVPGLSLRAALPAPADLVLFKDGRAMANTHAALWQLPIAEPGVYRLEASQKGQPWIFSNPIHIRPAPARHQTSDIRPQSS